jgi:phosphate transport system substrate-binding protein
MTSKKTSKRISFLIIGLLIAAGFIAGCGQQDNKAPGDNQNSGELTGTLTIAGSTSVQPFSEVLAEKFMEKNPGVQINVQGGGSSQGVEAAISGVADIGAASRELKDEEKAKNLVVTTLANDGIAIVIHPANRVNDLRQEEVKNIYLGNITNWKNVGGEDEPIAVVCREDGSGTRGAFEELVMNGEEISDKAIIQNSNGALRTTVVGDKNAIGFLSLAHINKEVKAVNIEGAAATVENIKNGTYKIYRPLNYVTKTAPRGLAKAYIDFVLSDEGQAIVVEEGAISI